ncbi:MAG TPA: PaaI family thioesterase [Pseudonocardia sp.]|jgi:uncharacterized protein (TIGR00369 family)
MAAHAVVSGDGDVAQEPVVRRREHEWGDPRRTAAIAAGMDGLAFIRAMAAGELPAPAIASTLGFELTEVEAGRVVFELRPQEWHYNPIGSVHGGVYATILDSATGCAVHSMLPAGVRYTSLDLSVKFLRGVTVDSGLLRCEGTVQHLGHRTGLAFAELRGADGRLYAHATSSLLILRD